MDRPTREKFLPNKLCDNAIRFQCSYCNSNYARKASLNTHVKQKHQENDIINDKEVSPQQIVNKDKFSENDQKSIELNKEPDSLSDSNSSNQETEVNSSKEKEVDSSKEPKIELNLVPSSQFEPNDPER